MRRHTDDSELEYLVGDLEFKLEATEESLYEAFSSLATSEKLIAALVYGLQVWGEHNGGVPEGNELGLAYDEALEWLALRAPLGDSRHVSPDMIEFWKRIKLPEDNIR